MQYQDLLIEVGTEELPPLSLKKLGESLLSEFCTQLDQHHLSYDAAQAFYTPRRLALIINKLAINEPDSETVRKGPAEKAAFNDDGSPSKALSGFARSCKVTSDELIKISTDKGSWYAYKIARKGQATASLIPAMLQKALERLPVAKRMRWGNLDEEFVRPVHWLVVLFGDEVIPLRMFGVKSDRYSRGHRFHHPDKIKINSVQSYISQLEGAWVIADFERRQQIIKQQVMAEATKLGGQAVIEDSLLAEVTSLVEYPVALSGSFDQRFLDIPPEAIIAFMQGHQKFFPVLDNDHKLLPAFITVSNIKSSDINAVIEGNQRVIHPRLSDALFFWQQDNKQDLTQMAAGLKNVVYEKQLGSVYDKTQRVGKLAEYLAAKTTANPELVTRAAKLAKADLLSGMVGEFPSLQGIMGKYYAQHAGEHEEVCQAIEEQYLPRHAKDQLPQSLTGITLALAERLDTITGIIGIGQKPSGEKDPYALRRAALGILRTIIAHDLDIDLRAAIEYSASLFAKLPHYDLTDTLGFILQRFRGMKQDEELAVFNAVAAVATDNIIDFNRREQATLKFMRSADAPSLAQANKRIDNILKKSATDIEFMVDENLLTEPAEANLYTTHNDLLVTIKPDDYQDTLKKLSSLRVPIDDFFDHVMVMSDDKKLQHNRLSLLHLIRQSFLQVADISQIQV